jgi:hypothetical protein
MPTKSRVRVDARGFVWIGPPSTQAQACIRADVTIYLLGNYIMDATVHLSHGQPSNHHRCPRLSVRLATLA